MNELSIFNGELTEQQRRAVDLHNEIMRNCTLAATALVDFCGALKEMRDSKMYAELGYESFEDYVEKAVGLRQRQAYNYIQALESFGREGLHSNAKLGITKLTVLASLSEDDRAEILEEHPVDELTVKQLKELTAELAAAKKTVAEQAERISELEDDEHESNAMISELESQVRFLKDKAKPSTPSAEMLQEYADKMVAQALEEAKKKHERELASASKKAASEGDKAVQAAKDEERKRVQAEMSAAVAEAEAAKTQALERLAQLESSAKVSASPEILKFKFYFDEVQKYLTELQNIIQIADEPTAEKLANAFDALLKQFGGSNGI